MASKTMFLLLVSILLVTSKGSSQDELKTKVTYAKVAVAAPPPLKAPVYSPPSKTTPPASSINPPISAPPVKSPPSVKPPVYSPPPTISPMPPVRSKKDCVPLCQKRCGNHSRMNLCLRACNTCCDRCKCVPPGTYGNREVCGKCYTDMTTRGNKPKCP